MAQGKTLTVYLAADLKKFNQGMKSAEGTSKGFGDNLNKYLGPALLAAGAAAGVFALKLAGDAIGAARDLAETQNKVGVIFGESSKSILSFAENAVTALGQTQQQALDAAATFAQFGKAAGLSAGDLAGFSTELVTLSADLASFNNSSPEQAITAIGAALRGEAEPLRNFGVLLDDATLRARAMEMGIYEGSGALTQQQKVLAAHQEILAQTTDAQGDFGRTSEGLANTQKILQSAIEDAKAEIGIGLVDALESASKAMGGSKGMANAIESGGEAIGNFTRGLGILVGQLAQLTDGLTGNSDAAEESSDSQDTLTNATRLYLGQIAVFLPGLVGITTGLYNQGAAAQATAKQIDSLYDSTISLAKANRFAAFEAQQAKKDAIATAYDSGIAAKQEAEYIERMTRILGHVPLAFQIATDETDTNTTATGSNTKAVDALTKAEERLQAQFDKRANKLSTTATALEKEIGLLKDAQAAVNNYATGIQNNLLSALDLSAAFSGQFDKNGEKTGEGWLTAFDKQIDLATAFGNNLNKLKASGVDQSLIEELASLGAPVGNAIVTDMLEGGEGLIQTLNDKWVNVQSVTRTLAQGLVPEFLLAGEMSAVETVNGLATQLAKETNRLNKLGKNMAKPVGASFKAQILEDIAEAVRQVESIGTAARAEQVARAERQQIALTDQAVAQALQNLVRGADSRNGRPLSPVLS
jgi:hypothetical protein